MVGLPSPLLSQREASGYRDRDPQDRAASPPLRMGPTGPIDDDGGAPMPCPSTTCGVRPNGTGDAGLPSRRTGDVRPAKTGIVSPRHVLWLDPRRGGRLGLAVIAYLF
jgi:hypothetical protein